MNKPRKSSRPPAEGTKLPDFPDYTVEQVMEVARMLYALRPFDLSNVSRCRSLAREAFDFLDKMQKACAEVAQQRSATSPHYRRAEARSAEAANLPDVVPFEKAVLFITGEQRTARAIPKLQALLLHNPRYFGQPFGERVTPRAVQRTIRRWRKTGIARGEAMELQALFEKSWPKIKAEQNRAKATKRKPWTGERVSKTLDKTHADVMRGAMEKLPDVTA